MATGGPNYFRLEGEAGSAVRALHQTASAIRDLDVKVTGLTRVIKRQNGLFNEFAGGLRTLGAAFVGPASFVAGVQAYTYVLEEAGRRTSEFVDETRGLLSLPHNAKNIEAVERKVLSLSNAAGVSTGEISAAFFNVESQADSLGTAIQDKIVRSSIALKKAVGVDLALAVTGLTKIMVTYGDQVDSVTDAQNRLLHAANIGGMSPEDMATVMPILSPAAKGAKVALNEALALMAVGTAEGQQPSVMARQARNILTTMADEQRVGFSRDLPLLEKLEKVGQMDFSQRLKLFGEEGIVLSEIMVEKIDLVRQRLEELNNLSPKRDMIAEIMKERLKSQEILFDETSKAIAQKDANRMVGLESTKWALTGLSVRESLNETAIGRVLAHIPGVTGISTGVNYLGDAFDDWTGRGANRVRAYTHGAAILQEAEYAEGRGDVSLARATALARGQVNDNLGGEDVRMRQKQMADDTSTIKETLLEILGNMGRGAPAFSTPAR